MAIEIYGASDDLVEIEGHITDEVNTYDKVMLVCSDGTVCEAKYGKPTAGGVWGITVHAKGSEFIALEECFDEDADRYSDTLRLGDGVKWIASAKKWSFRRAKK